MKKIYNAMMFSCISMAIYGLYFDIRLNRKYFKKDLRIHILQL